MKRNIFILLIVASILIVFSILIFASETIDVKDYIKDKFPSVFSFYLSSLEDLDSDEKEFIDLLQNLPEEEQKNFAKEVYNNGFSKEILEKIKKEGIITKPGLFPSKVSKSEQSEKIKEELAKELTDEELKDLVIGLGITQEDFEQLAKELTREEYDMLLWGMKWAQELASEYIKHRVDDPEEYDVQGLRSNADFKVDVGKWERQRYPKIEEGTYWVPAAKLGTPNTTKEELLRLKGQPEKAKKEINVLFEALAFIHLCMEPGSGNAKTEGKKGIRWEFPKPAEPAIRDGTVNCASAANVIHYLLEDDYDEVGYIWRHSPFDSHHVGGHCTSVVRPTLLYIWRSLPKYAPPERSRRKSLDFGCDFPGSL